MSSETDTSVVRYVQDLLNSDAPSDTANHDPERGDETTPRETTTTGELETVVDSVPFPAAAVAGDGRIVALNAAYAEFFGVSASDLRNVRLGEADAVPETVAARPARTGDRDTKTTVDLPDDASTVRVTIRSKPYDVGSTGDAGGVIQTVVPHASLADAETDDAESGDASRPAADEAGNSPRPATDAVKTEEAERPIADEEAAESRRITDDVEAVASALRQGENGPLEEAVSPETTVVVDELVPAIERYAADSSPPSGDA
ncbi:MAG: PAS domain-containing protein, partial [Halobaculum sp.]